MCIHLYIYIQADYRRKVKQTSNDSLNGTLLSVTSDTTNIRAISLSQQRTWKATIIHHDTFTYVIVATVIFNIPNKPTFPGIETFTGRIIHSHDFRDANEYKE